MDKVFSRTKNEIIDVNSGGTTLCTPKNKGDESEHKIKETLKIKWFKKYKEQKIEKKDTQVYILQKRQKHCKV